MSARLRGALRGPLVSNRLPEARTAPGVLRRRAHRNAATRDRRDPSNNPFNADQASFLMRIALAVLLLLVPGAAAVTVGVQNPDGPTPVALYFHLLDSVDSVPVNTQVPREQFMPASRLGMATHSLCFDELADLPPPAGQPLVDKEWHTVLAYSSPSYVEYEVLESGQPRLHPERVMGYSIQMDAESPATLHWYLQTHAGVQGDAGQPPVIVPGVVVEATMRDGDATFVGDDAFREGAVLMHGRSAPATLARQATSGATWESVGGRDVYGFEVPLTVDSPAIPATGYTIEINVYIDNPHCASGAEGDYIMPNMVSNHWDPDRLPRVEMSVFDPLRIEYLAPQFVGDELVVHAAVQSPRGQL
jgi:hypothetical protein